MQNHLKLALAATLVAGGFAPAALFADPAPAPQIAQADQAMQPAPEQIQANPRGSDAPAVAAPNPSTANSAVAPSMPNDPSYQAGAYAGALSPPPAADMNKTYPICGHGMHDECRNPRGW